jgi:hypothetical protein
LFTALNFFRLGVRGKAQEGAARLMRVLFMSTNGLGQFVSIHDRHVAIGDHQVENVGFPCRKSCLAICRDAESMAQRLSSLKMENRLNIINNLTPRCHQKWKVIIINYGIQKALVQKFMKWNDFGMPVAIRKRGLI